MALLVVFRYIAGNQVGIVTLYIIICFRLADKLALTAKAKK